MTPFPAVGTRALVVLGMMAVVGCAASREETNRTSFVPREPSADCLSAAAENHQSASRRYSGATAGE
jgi:hypothetical protein